MCCYLQKYPRAVTYVRRFMLFMLLGGLAGALVLLLSTSTIEFEGGILAPEVTSIVMPYEGKIAQVYVHPQQHIAKQAPLFALDDVVQANDYATAKAALLEAELQAPPEDILALYETASGNDELMPLGKQLEKLREAERTAQEQVHMLSTVEAQAALAVRRPQGQRPDSEVTLLQQRYLKARQELEQAKKQYESISIERAGLESDMQKLRFAQQELEQRGLIHGTKAMRLAVYKERFAKARAAQHALEATVMRAPAAGVVQAVFLASGHTAAKGTQVMAFVPEDAPWQAKVRVSKKDAYKLAVGMECQLELSHPVTMLLTGFVTQLEQSETNVDIQESSATSVLTDQNDHDGALLVIQLTEQSVGLLQQAGLALAPATVKITVYTGKR